MANEVRLEDVCGKVFGLTPRRYRQLAKQGSVPPVKDGKIVFILAVKSLIGYYRNLAQGQGTLSLTDARTREANADARLKELELKKALGEVVEAATAMKLWGRIVSNIRAKLLSLPSKISPMLLGLLSIAEIKEKLDQEVYETLTELSSPNLKNAGSTDDKESAADVRTAAKTHHKPVGRRKKGLKSGNVRGTGKMAKRKGAVHGGRHGRHQRPKGGKGGGNDKQPNRKD